MSTSNSTLLKDFKFTTNIEFSEILIVPGNIIDKEKLQNIIYVRVIALYNIYKCPLILTIALQLIMRILEKIKRISMDDINYIIICCFRLACVIEYDVHDFIYLKDIADKINCSVKDLKENQMKILLLLNFELYRDNFYNKLSDEEKNLLKKREHLSDYLKKISSFDSYM